MGNSNTIMTTQMYDAQADTIKIEDIASNDNNRLMLRRIKRNNSDDHDRLIYKMTMIMMGRLVRTMFLRVLM